MNRTNYDEFVKFLEGKTKETNKEKLKVLEKLTKNYETKLGNLYKKNKNGKSLRVIKEDEVDSILWITHNHPTGGHFAKDSIYTKLVDKYYWKGMYKDIEDYVKRCDACQRRGQQGGKGFLNPIKVGKPFERIRIDFVGPLPKTISGNKYIIVATDYLTKWPEAKATKEATAETVVEFLYKEIICRHGCPTTILSDRGTHFRNKVVNGLCEKFTIKHKLSSPYHPQTNGLVERFNRTLCEALAKVTEEEEKWDQYIEPVLFAYRTNEHSTIKRTPFYMMHGREAKLPVEIDEPSNKFPLETSILERTYQLINLKENQVKVWEALKKTQEKQRRRYNERIKEETEFKIGDKVLLKDAAKEKQWSGKLTPKWKGPYYIHNVITAGAYRLKTLEGRVLKASFNVKHLKGYNEQNLPIVYI
jgi:Integrase zinc binding domain/Integrase core domain